MKKLKEGVDKWLTLWYNKFIKRKRGIKNENDSWKLYY